MPLTLTSTAYSNSPNVIDAGLNAVFFDFTGAAGVTFCASANATVILGPKIQNQSMITSIEGSHSSGADSCPVDIGIDASLSKFASQKTQGTNAITTKTTLPFKVSVSDDAIPLYRVIKFAATPGTNTAAVNFKYTVNFKRDVSA